MDDQNVQSSVSGADQTAGVGQTPAQPTEPTFTPPAEPAQSVSPTGDPVLVALGRIEEKLTAIATKVGA